MMALMSILVLLGEGEDDLLAIKVTQQVLN